MRRLLLPLTVFSALVLVLPAAAQHYNEHPQQLVSTWYQRFLDRAPDEQGIITWVDALRRGQAPETVLSGILGSQEYANRSGGTDEGFVQTLYVDLVGRRPTAQEYDFWMRRTRFDSHRDIATALLLRYPESWRPKPYTRPNDDYGYDYRRPFQRYPK